MNQAKQIKAYLLAHCNNYLQKRYNSVSKTLSSIKFSLESETKSSAGDKHETGRAMLQLEREKTSRQLLEINREKQILNRISSESTSQIICLGSLVLTSNTNYFIAISAGEIQYEGVTYYAISPAAPVARLLMGKKREETFLFQRNEITIKEVF